VKTVAALVLALLSPGCLSFGAKGEPLEVRSFDLQPPMPDPYPPETEGMESLWVEPFSVDPALDRSEIVWRRGGGEAGAWERYTWARPPAEAVRAVLADALARSGACAVVATEPRVLSADYVLRGHLVRFEEVDGAEAWGGAFEVRVALVRASDGEEILRRTYAGVEKAPARNPGGVVAALRSCLGAAARRLVADVVEVLAAEREPEGK
jgi:ABC-type uncharacterized transport system auxiliary subunit